MRAADALRRSARDADAFVSFYSEHAEALLAFFVRRVYDPDVAFDLTAETFAQAYQARRRFRGRTDKQAAAWLYRIARRQRARYFRKGKAEHRALSKLGIERPQLDDQQRARLEEVADLEGLRSVLRAELERLSSAHREALGLRVIEELPYPEVAKRLTISEEAARARVSRGLKALAAALDSNPRFKETQV